MTELSQFKTLVPTAEELPALRQALAAGLSPELAQQIGSILELLPRVVQLIERKDMSMNKLRQQLFGLKTESTRNVCGAPPQDKPKAKTGGRKGHGRRGHRQYPEPVAFVFDMPLCNPQTSVRTVERARCVRSPSRR